MTFVSKKYSLSKTRLYSFLDDLENNVDGSAVSLYLPPGLNAQEIEESVISAGMNEVPDGLPGMIENSRGGAATFYNGKVIHTVLPAFPIKEKVIFTDYATEPLRTLMDIDYRIGIILVHLGSYAVGLCKGEKIVTSKVGTGLVHGRHRKGGSSQQRFQRRRQNQANEFLDRVCERAIEHLSPQEKELDYIIYGGPRQTVLQLKKRCPFLQSLEERELSLIDVPEIRQPVLEKALNRIWMSSIIEWREE
ncbi:acVLRF1 family peptidyl-tRNA hydrolase [Chloroflexota bacterium]